MNKISSTIKPAISAIIIVIYYNFTAIFVYYRYITTISLCAPTSRQIPLLLAATTETMIKIVNSHLKITII